jgi:hypothetical protein
MRIYVLVTGIIFALLAVMHVARAVSEGPQLFADPFFIGTTLIALGVFVWAMLLLRRRT